MERINGFSPEECNLQQNFPNWEPYIRLGDKEALDELGRSYVETVRSLQGFPNTFGLCGVLALHAAMLLNPYGIDRRYINYNVRDLIMQLKKVKARQKDALRPYDFFVQRYSHLAKIETHTVQTPEELYRIFKGKRNNKANILGTAYPFAVICKFPLHGSYTHWLALKNLGEGEVAIFGDLSPLGLIDMVSIKTNVDEVVKSMAQVLNTKPHKNVAKAIEDPKHKIKSNKRNFDSGTFPFNLCTVDPEEWYSLSGRRFGTCSGAWYYDVMRNYYS